jgi:hypothetical protein
MCLTQLSASPYRWAGVVSQHRSGDAVRDDGYRLLPRYTFDLVAPPSPEARLVPVRLPETGQRPE